MAGLGWCGVVICSSVTSGVEDWRPSGPTCEMWGERRLQRGLRRPNILGSHSLDSGSSLVGPLSLLWSPLLPTSLTAGPKWAKLQQIGIFFWLKLYFSVTLLCSRSLNLQLKLHKNHSSGNCGLLTLLNCYNIQHGGWDALYLEPVSGIAQHCNMMQF